jgi:hypothetical protein
MKANELRIGNWYYTNDGKATQIDGHGISQFQDGEELDVENTFISAIPLTEEWLLKFGFENNIHGNHNRYFKDGIYPRSFAFQFYKNGRVDFWYGDFNVGNLNRIKYNPLQYVHQLQNLYFALTGKELEYEQN